MKQTLTLISFVIITIALSSCVKERTENIHFYDEKNYGGVDASKGLTINEICNHGCTYYDDLDTANPDHWLEIYNVSDNDIVLDQNSYYYLSGSPVASGSPGVSLSGAFRLNSFTVPKHGTIIVFVDGLNTTTSTMMHANFHLNKHGNEFVGLYQRVMPIDTVRALTIHTTDTVASGATMGVYMNGSDHWQIYRAGTPNATNPHP